MVIVLTSFGKCCVGVLREAGVTVASDDPYNIPFSLGQALRASKIPFELHITPKDGHGYGLRKGNPAAEAWPALAQSWLKSVL